MTESVESLSSAALYYYHTQPHRKTESLCLSRAISDVTLWSKLDMDLVSHIPSTTAKLIKFDVKGQFHARDPC